MLDDLKLKLINTKSIDPKSILNNVQVDEFDQHGNNLLHYFVKNADSIDVSPAKFIQSLVSNGLDINHVQRMPPGRTALHLAVFEKNETLVRLLIELGSHVDIGDENGNTPLWQSVMNYRNDSSFFIEYLIENGANPDKENKHGVSPRALAETIANFDSKRFF